MSLDISGLSAGYGAHRVLDDVTINDLKPGEVIAIIGPNAAGKSTLFRTIAGLIRPLGGQICFAGQDVATMPPAERAAHIFYMPQVFAMNAVLSVFEVVLLALKQSGRATVSADDIGTVEMALDRLGISRLADRIVSELSGGQQQLVSIAQALVRAPSVMLLDEPTSALDLRHQIDVLQRVGAATRERGSVSLVALHDLNLAARFADRIILMGQGRVVSDGSPVEVLSSARIQEIYGVTVETGFTASGQLYVAPLDTMPAAIAAE